MPRKKALEMFLFLSCCSYTYLVSAIAQRTDKDKWWYLYKEESTLCRGRR